MGFLRPLCVLALCCVPAAAQAPHLHTEQASVEVNVSKLPPPVKMGGIGHSHITITTQSPPRTKLLERSKLGQLLVALHVACGCSMRTQSRADTPKEGHDHGVVAHAPVYVSRVDDIHGNTLAAYRAMGSPAYPTQDQVEKLNEETKLPPSSRGQLEGDYLDLRLGPNALVIVETEPGMR